MAMMAAMLDGIDLSPYLLFQTADLDEVRHRVSRVFCPHSLDINGPGQALDSRMEHMPLGRVSFNRLSWGASVHVDPGRLENFFLVSMPLAGRAAFRLGQQTIDVGPSCASVISPTLPFSFDADRDFCQAVIRFERDSLERSCAAMLGYPLDEPVEFHGAFETTGEAWTQWSHLVAFLTRNPNFAKWMARYPLSATQLEQFVIGTLLFLQPHNYSERLRQKEGTVAPYYVKRAEEFLHAHVDQPITPLDMAAHAGVSQRTLFAGFREYRHTTPMTMLRDLRLERVRQSLSSPRVSSLSVTEVALRWGFTHLGSFGEAYREKFGETPSATLAAGKGSLSFDHDPDSEAQEL